MAHQDEAAFEKYIRKLIKNGITKKHPHIYALDNKKAVDILICREGESPALFFLEVKYHKPNHGRLGFGSKLGGGFQPEIVSRAPSYFESNLRWVIGSQAHAKNGIIFVPSSVIREYVSGGDIEKKFNNIQKRIFREIKGLGEKSFVNALQTWLTCT